MSLRLSRCAALLGTALAVASTGAGVAAVAHGMPHPSPSYRAGGNSVLATTISGRSEVDDQGMPVAPRSTVRGSVTLQVVSQDELCYALTIAGLGAGDHVTMAHIHRARIGQNGPVVIPLSMDLGIDDAPATAGGCVTDLDPDLLRDIRHHPRAYYFNLHSVMAPKGLARGQLRPSPME